MKVPKLCRNPDGRAYATVPKSGGKRVYFGEWGAPGVEERYRGWLVGVLNYQPEVVSGVYSLAQVVEKYLIWAKGEFSRARISFLKSTMVRLLTQFPALPASGLSPQVLLRHRDWLVECRAERHGKVKALSRVTINASVRAIRMMARWASARGYMPEEAYMRLLAVEPLKSGRTSAAEPADIQPVPLEDVLACLPYIDEPLKTVVQVQYLCGMRPGEVLGMRGEWLTQSGEVWVYHPQVHKTKHRGAHLYKAVPPAAQELLAPYLKEEGLIFHTRRKGRITTSYYGLVVAEAAKKAGVPHWSPNRLRHALATKLRETQGWEAAQVYLGHASPNTTGIYAKRTIAAVSSVAMELEDPFTNPKPEKPHL